MLHLVSTMAEHLTVRSDVDEEIEELKPDVEAAEVLDKIEHADGEGESSKEDARPRPRNDHASAYRAINAARPSSCACGPAGHCAAERTTSHPRQRRGTARESPSLAGCAR